MENILERIYVIDPYPRFVWVLNWRKIIPGIVIDIKEPEKHIFITGDSGFDTLFTIMALLKNKEYTIVPLSRLEFLIDAINTFLRRYKNEKDDSWLKFVERYTKDLLDEMQELRNFKPFKIYNLQKWLEENPLPNKKFKLYAWSCDPGKCPEMDLDRVVEVAKKMGIEVLETDHWFEWNGPGYECTAPNGFRIVFKTNEVLAEVLRAMVNSGPVRIITSIFGGSLYRTELEEVKEKKKVKKQIVESRPRRR